MVIRLALYSPQSPWWSSEYSYIHHSLLGGIQTIPIHITVSLVVLRLSLNSSQSSYWLRQSLYSSQSPWLYSDYTFTHHSLSGGPQNIPLLITVYLVAQTISILITVSLVVLRLSLYSSQTPWLYSDYTFTHHSLSGGPQNIHLLITVYLVAQTISILITVSLCGPHSIPIHITFCLVVLRVSLYSSQPPWLYSDYPFTHHNLPGGTQTFLYSSQSTWWLRQSLYSSQSPWWYSDYPYTHHSLDGGTQTISTLITVSLVVLRLSLYSSKSLWWYSDYPYSHHSLFGGPQSIPINIKFRMVVLRLSLYSLQSPWWYLEYPYAHNSLPGGTQTINILIKVSLRVLITVSLMVLRLFLYSSQSP